VLRRIHVLAVAVHDLVPVILREVDEVGIEAGQALGVHWGSFELAQDAFDQAPRDLAVALQQRQLASDRVWMLKQGKTRQLRAE